MAKVMQGTTPSLRIKIKTDEFYVTDIWAVPHAKQDLKAYLIKRR